MNDKFYISLEAARLLKEKGYDERTDFFIDEYGIWKWDNRAFLDLPCPTKDEAIDWLESKGIYIDLLYTLDGKWDCAITIPSRGIIIDDIELSNTRLEAEEAAIIKALELL